MAKSPRAEATRRALLASARACFAETGPSRTTTRQIADRAGVTQPLIHHYFGTKDALFAAVIEDALADYDLVQAEQWALPPGDLRFLTVGLVVLFRWIGQHPDLLRLSAWARLEGQTGETKLTARIYQRVRARFLAAQQEGVIREGVDIDAALLMIDALFKGFWDRHASYEAFPLLDTVEARFLRTALEILYRGLLAPDRLDEALASCRALEPG